METSAKTAANVDEAFLQTATNIYEKIKGGTADMESSIPKKQVGSSPPLNQQPKKQSGECCG